MESRDDGEICMSWKEIKKILEVEERREENLRLWMDPNLGSSISYNIPPCRTMVGLQRYIALQRLLVRVQVGDVFRSVEGSLVKISTNISFETGSRQDSTYISFEAGPHQDLTSISFEAGPRQDSTSISFEAVPREDITSLSLEAFPCKDLISLSLEAVPHKDLTFLSLEAVPR
ncbi:hypothetical protein L2E82_48080 [Cichorium intybus]|uniref:Uncharacterized protein n=1 Tax=Cichorium intybus TaxID=13427 RepID=A0ACB8YYJ1_CICIN|nr:hypothetical protein L2E82_48080 [Cichorium intybus]